MTKIIFKNLETSSHLRDLVNDRLAVLFEKFSDLKEHKIMVTLSMENSPLHPGPDYFSVALRIDGKKYQKLILKKSAKSMYIALAEVCDHTLELLNRFGDKVRIRKRKKSRIVKTKLTQVLPDNCSENIH